MFERISPGKTWEGLAGGALACCLTAIALPHFFNGLSAGNWMVTASIVIVAGTYGDLSKSLLKRSIGVKDSGNIIPGHGGILDRLDSFLFSSVFVTVFVLYAK